MNNKDVLKKLSILRLKLKGCMRKYLYFIKSVHIRRGEFECNEYIIKKIGRDTFFIYPEYELKDGSFTYTHIGIVSKSDFISELEREII